MSAFIHLENTRNLIYLVVHKQYMFRGRNNRCGIIAHKLGTSAISLPRNMKNGSKPWNQLESNV